ncbi:sodium:neurotransmitter symporter [Streptomyces chilikensis]|uniref:sodium:neurotransmitter symporter n=1 Tax=Streptomyces chilikensis TaxID=1194079 RepID=UPI000A41C459|nr:sodium:neurotransmitter symporter [Streptomyces chilikensis]
MRTAAMVAAALIALLCGIALLCLGVEDAGDGNARAVLPIVTGAVLTAGGLLFLRKGYGR